jgi:riboflavin biosynthesis pyrimidine reductase
MDPMRRLFEAEEPASRLPPTLADLYGGHLELRQELLYANFVSSLDGVTALSAPAASPSLLSGRNSGDRFLLGLLRALADAVVVGAGTLRAEPDHLWTASYINRSLTAAFAELGRPDPRTVIVSATGHIDPAVRSLQQGALVLTTDAGAAHLRSRLPGAASLVSLGPGAPRGKAILAALHAEGYRRVLTEGGPTLMATFLADRLLDELFLTLSPLLAGRLPRDGRLGLVEGLELLPDLADWARLLSVRAHGSHLFLRYSWSRSGAA